MPSGSKFEIYLKVTNKRIKYKRKMKIFLFNAEREDFGFVTYERDSSKEPPIR